MARYVFPNDRQSFEYEPVPNTPVRNAMGTRLAVYTDQACTHPADIQTYPDSLPTSALVVGQDSLIPEFYGPDGNAGPLWIRIVPDGQPIMAVRRYSDFFAEVLAQMSSMGSGNLKTLALDPDLLISGTITRDPVTGAVTLAQVVWPDGTPGTFTTDVLSSTFAGAIDAYHITYGSPVTRTYTQPQMTRNAQGAVTVRPAIVVS